MTKIYFRNVIFTDDSMLPTIIRGYYYEEAPYVYKQMIFSY